MDTDMNTVQKAGGIIKDSDCSFKLTLPPACTLRKISGARSWNRRTDDMRLIILHGFLVMLMSVAIDSSCYMKTNGCTVPSRLPRFYKKDFTPACKKHDVCYSCILQGQRYRWRRSRCDNSFHRNMKKICSRKSYFERKLCRKFAHSYFRAARKGGSPSYAYTSPAWCCASCVKFFGNPNRRWKR
ncbi:Conodipine-P3 [Acropora cervicornis]|uniref:Conodipine-P3 n=1 Tax=Acropora cervicornis TaxID=6130 RepID=A0AAD9UX34_ACRCE|nr:Conodipine-P3 [Acropora cervicornis]